ncbi:PadR family transcriptional regulator [Candidatus Bathyarchaeota archaeon]|nr:MAG: PadR family transcriptional regulator [Candidatus Bathyarchaeota archaeon]
MVSDIEASILGLICENVSYGYEIEKTIEERNMRQWTEIGFSSIYYVLKRLEKQGQIKSSTETIQGRARKIYKVTPEGKREMKNKVIDLLNHYQSIISPLDMGIAFMNQTTEEEAKEALGFYLRSIEDRKASLEARLDVIERSDWPYQIKELCIRPLMLLKIERAWALGFIESIKEHERDKEERKGDA